MVNILPDCMAPDGAEPCKGYAELRDELAHLRELTTLPSDLDGLVERLNKRQVLGNNQGAVYLASEHDDLCVEAANALVAMQARVSQLEALDQEAGTYVEADIALRTKFTGEPPYVRAARDFLSAPGAAGGWRTMESAPKDGTIVEAKEDGEGWVQLHRVSWRTADAAAGHYDGGLTWRDAHGFALTPTHWRPLPSPPQEGA